MCLNPKYIINRSKYIDPFHGDKLYFQVPCGDCPECDDQKINAYIARTDAEMRETNTAHGLCYVDCLTYDDFFLPILTKDNRIVRNNGEKAVDHIYSKGIPVFNLSDLRKMFYLLRSSLCRAGYYDEVKVPQYDLDGNITYKKKKLVRIKHFVSFEYGGQFHRPHCHIEFFIKHAISPEVFESFLRKAWRYGMLDKFKKVPDNNSSLGYRVVPKTPQDKVISAIAGCAYVAKYAVKDDDYIDFVCDHILGKSDDNMTTKEKKKAVKEFIDPVVFANLFPRPLVSNGFGISLANKYLEKDGKIEYNRDYISMFDTGTIQVKNRYGDVTNICMIPQYIQRKLWYERVKAPDFSDTWQLNEDGLKYKAHRLNKTIDLVVQRYQNILQNIGNYYDHPNDERNLQYRNKIFDLLNGRSLSDFVVYKMVYKNSMYRDMLSFTGDIYYDSLKLKRKFTDFNYDFSKTFNFFDEDILSLKHKLVNLGVKFGSRLFRKLKTRYDLLPYIQNLALNDLSVDEWRDFDKLDNFFMKLEKYRCKERLAFRRLQYEDRKKQKLLDPIYLQHENNNQHHRQSILSQINYIRYYDKEV